MADCSARCAQSSSSVIQKGNGLGLVVGMAGLFDYLVASGAGFVTRRNPCGRVGRTRVIIMSQESLRIHFMSVF